MLSVNYFHITTALFNKIIDITKFWQALPKLGER